MQMIKLEMCPGDMDAHADAKFAYSLKANKSSASSTITGGHHWNYREIMLR